MRKIIQLNALLILLLVAGDLRAQNLVLNPSFENTTGCPLGPTQLDLCVDWDDANSGADTCSSPDLFAGCSFLPIFNTPSPVNVPNNMLGFQNARTGDHYAGFILLEGISCNIPPIDDYREYIEGKLSQPLQAGQKYCVKFYTSLGENAMWAVDAMGVYFSNNKYERNACISGNEVAAVTPQLNWCGGMLTDTANWQELKWVYTATGGEQYFTIGNFKNNANTNHQNNNCGSLPINGNSFAYYYIDDVSVTPGCCADSLVFSNITTPGCGIATASVTAAAFSVTCGSAGFTYAWSNGSTSQTITGVNPGTYTVTVSAGGGCTSTASINLNSLTTLGVHASSSNPSCGSNNGSATVAVTSGGGPYTYNWSNGGTSASISGLGAGTYRVTVTGAAGCTATATANLLSASGLTLSSTDTAASCSGNNGSSKVLVSGGNAPYTYLWSNGQTTQTATGLAAGTYNVTVHGDTTGADFYTEDFNSGGSTWTLNLNGPTTNGAQANTWIVNSDNNCTCGSGNYLHVTCNPTSFFCTLQTGQCIYDPEPNFVYNATTDRFVSSPDISTLGKSNITLKFSYAAVGQTNHDYGNVRLSADGGVNWTDLPTKYQDSANCTLATVSIPSTYENITNFRIGFRWRNDADGDGNDPGFAIDNVHLTAASGNCPATLSVTIPSAGGLNLSTSSTQASCGQNNGTAGVSITSGTGPYTYTWSNNATTQNLTGLAAGQYNVTVHNQSGCSATATSIVGTNGTVPSLTPTSTAAGCSNNNGSASVTVSPTGTYTYIWSNGATANSISGVASGTYVVTVTGSGSCSASVSVSVGSTGTLVLSANATPTSCGANNGAATVSITSGTGPYTYLWSNNSTLQNLSNVAAGNYQVTVTGSGCTATASASVAASTGITLSSSATGTSCGGSNGSASVSVTAGSGPYSYLWSNNSTLQSLSNLASGNYQVTVTGGGGCTMSATATVASSTGLSVTPTAVATTCGSNNGTANVSVTVGTGPYTYHWSNSSTAQNISGLGSGSYFVTVTGGGGCTASASASIAASTGVTATTSSTDAGCTALGTATVNITSGSGPFTYLWSNSATSQTANNLSGGNYTVTVTGGGGCSASSSVTVNTTGNGVALSVTSTPTTCGATSGTASVSVTAGSAPFSYLWSNGATTSNISSVGAGNYTVTVTGGGGCTALGNVSVNTTGGLVFTSNVTNTSCGNNNGAVSLNITTGTGPYAYIWSNGATTAGLTNAQPGSYQVTVTGAGGCSSTDAVTVQASNGITASATAVATICGGANGSATAIANTGDAPFTYLWSNSATTATISSLASGLYLVTVTDNSGCSTTASVNVDSSSTTVININADKQIMCPTDSAYICAEAGYTGYQWNTGDTSRCIYTNEAGNYYVSATSGNCVVTSPHLTIQTYQVPAVSIQVSGDTLTSFGSTTYQWYLDGQPIVGATGPVIIAQQSGSYSVAITDAHGCTTFSSPTTITVSGIEALSTSGRISIYPNPLSVGGWHLEVGAEWISATCQIFDAAGKLVHVGQIENANSEITLNLSGGVYVLRLFTAHKNYECKLIKL